MRRRFLLSTAIFDLITLGGSLLLASALVLDHWLPWKGTSLGVGIMPLLGFLVFAASVMAVATSWMWGAGVPRPTYARGTVIILGTLGLTSLFLVATRASYPRSLLGAAFPIWLGAAMAHRAWQRRRPWTESMVLVTDDKDMAEAVAAAPHADVVSVLAPQSEGDVDVPPPGTTLVVDFGTVLSERMAQLVSSMTLAGYTVKPLTSVYEEHTGKIPLVHLAEGWEISDPLNRTSPFLPGKRAFDFLFAALTAPVWLSLCAATAALVKMVSGGPVIFRQERVGLNSQPFTIYKFRSMNLGADEDGPRFAAKDDERLIPFGSLLRRSHLDELPQLWNVLKGELSLVGPRPEQVVFAGDFAKKIPFYSYRHLVRPGITGWAQVNFGYAEDTAETIEKLAYDLYYVKNLSPVLDLHVLWKSLWAVGAGFGR